DRVRRRAIQRYKLDEHVSVVAGVVHGHVGMAIVVIDGITVDIGGACWPWGPIWRRCGPYVTRLAGSRRTAGRCFGLIWLGTGCRLPFGRGWLLLKNDKSNPSEHNEHQDKKDAFVVSINFPF